MQSKSRNKRCIFSYYYIKRILKLLIKGDCFGHEVPADKDVKECPANAFQPRETEKEKEKK